MTTPTPWPDLLELADKHLPNATSGERLALLADVVALLERDESGQFVGGAL